MTVGPRASLTATCVAGLRALETFSCAPLVVDGEALCLCPPFAARLLAIAKRSSWATGLILAAPDLLSRGRQQHIVLRTRTVDELVTREVGLGAEQLLVLGAGFDTRAYRLAALDSLIVFEVDHPATQTVKRARGARLVPRALAQRFVPVDLERDTLAGPLASAGFSRESRSVVLWEGVTMYLGIDAIESTLSALASLCSRGSALLVTYHDSSGASGPASRSTALMVRLLGEPFRTERTPIEMRHLLAAHGFVVEDDTGRDDWARAAGRVPRGRAHERLVVARRA